MKKVITQDGSETYFSEKYQECFHSKSGAVEESFKKFIEPCKIKSGDRILDIGFGLGYNSLAAIFTVKKISIISLEQDTKVLEAIKFLKVPNYLQKKFEIIKKVAKDLKYKDNYYEIKIILGNAVETINQLDGKFDAVFLDPFSPPKNPELWTLDFLMKIRKLMKKEAILATYSCARIVRDNLKAAGFFVKDGPIVGRKSPGTLAIR